VALGGPDTAARTQVVWQVKVRQVEEADFVELACQSPPERWLPLLELLQSPARGQLRARARVPEVDIDRPCAIDPRAYYRHDENALFRVEVHTPGPVGTATFKWSLDNGAVAFPIESFAGTQVGLATLGRDARSTLQAGDWVELEYDGYVLQNRSEDLFLVQSVDYADLMVTLDRAPAPVPPEEHPRLRRWNQKGNARERLEPGGTIKIVEAANPDGPWIDLRHGVQVQFVQPPSGSPANQYRTGDFWLIPARVTIGDVVWPKVRDASGKQVPAARTPQGVEHHYAPLAHLGVRADGAVEVSGLFVRSIRTLAECPTT
jgi:hypothetical protein